MFMRAGMAPIDRVTARNILGRSPEDPVELRPDPLALSRSVISFKPRTRGWLSEAIKGLVGPEALENTGDYRKHSGEVARRPCGAQPRPPDPISLSNLI